MCIDHTNLNKACPKDAYLLPNIERLVDGACKYQKLSFLDAYSRYNQIKMYLPNEDKISFNTEDANFYYKVMSFRLKNVGMTYQRLMDKVFRNLMGKNIEVYVNNIVVKSLDPNDHPKYLSEILAELRKHNM